MVKRAKSGVVRQSNTVKLFSKDEENTEDAIPVSAMKRYATNQIEDPFKDSYSMSGATGVDAVLQPSFNPYALMHLPNENNILHQCIDAMVTNIESFGYRLEYVGEEGLEDSEEALSEKNKMESLLDTPNGEYSLIELRERVRRDKETFGYAFYELGRDLKGEIVMLHHVPAHTMRMTKKDDKPTVVEVPLMRDGKVVKQKVKKYFRRYVQTVGSNKVYFKELGDPRRIDPVTGKENQSLGIEEEATEVYRDYIYSPGDSYGLPRWINQLPSILGSRESELTNLQFFKDNAIPAMAILVSGGALTEESIRDIENHVYQGKGKKSINRVMILEATGDGESSSIDGATPAPRLDIKPLSADRQSDALFQEYDKHNQKKIRSSFRLPPIFVGNSEDMTYAVAEASLVMAEGQVFGTERNKVDDLFNDNFLRKPDGTGLKYWVFRSNPPRLSNPSTTLEAVKVFESVGAMTPNVAIGIANELFDLNIPLILEDWGNYPFSIVTSLADAGILKGIETLKLLPQEALAATNDEELSALEDKTIGALKELVVRSHHVSKMRSSNKKRVRSR